MASRELSEGEFWTSVNQAIDAMLADHKTGTVTPHP
jgi:hypothetical protein